MNKVVVTLDKPANQTDVLELRPDINLYTGKKEFIADFGKPTSLEEDLLTLGSAIFASDLAIKRDQREKINRVIELTVPVTNLAAFKNVAKDLIYALKVLSHDAWAINFVQRSGQPEEIRDWGEPTARKVLLFSGGLDSFSEAISLGEKGEKVQLVSHVTANLVVKKTQESLLEYLNQSFPGQFSRISFRVTGIAKPTKEFFFPQDKDREETQRTRSFMFLCLSALVARRCGIHELVMIAENGQMAIHLPLTAGRISAFSTHTAHPEFVDLMSGILTNILGFNIKIDNPFLYMTKSEVVKLLLPTHQPIIEKTVSCWKASRVLSDYRHCGFCIPCQVRRIALESNDIYLAEYKTDLLRSEIVKLHQDNDGKRNIVELCEFINIFKENLSMAELMVRFPELANDCFDAEKTVAMYRRFAEEAMFVFNHYPEVMKLMG